MAEIKIDDLDERQLQELSGRVAARREHLAVERGRIAEEEFSIDRIKPGMTADETRAAAKAIVRALGEKR